MSKKPPKSRKPASGKPQVSRKQSPPRTAPAAPKPAARTAPPEPLTPRSRDSRRSRAGDIDPALLPSREAILAALRNAGTPLPPADLERELAVGPVAREAFYGRLAAMERDGQILTNRKRELCVVAKLDLVIGTVQGHPDGFGFLVPDAGGDDYFLSPREMHKVLHGDRAALRKTGTDRRGRPEGEIVEVLARANREIVGRLYEERGIWFVVAENRRINQDLLIPPGDLGGATSGQVVVAEIVEQPAANREAIARIKEVLGSATDSGIEIEIALRKHALPFEFSADAEEQAKRLPTEVRAADRKDRVDLTSLPLVTIDGETAKDFDDAVYCERKGRNFRLVVAIADVSHYVRDGDPIDRDARERGTSVYFPAPRDPDAAGGTVERDVLAQGRRRPVVHGLRHGNHGGRNHQGLHVLSCRHAFARAPHLHAGVGMARCAGQGRHAEGTRAAAAPCESVRALSRPGRGAGQARRHRLRHGRAGHRIRRQGQDHAHRSGAAQRRAQADRGMHAGGQRLHGGVPGRAQARRALPRARGSAGRQAGHVCAIS